MNSKNKNSEKINLKRNDNYIALWNLSIYYIWKNMKNPYVKNTFKISASTWNEEFELPDESYYNYLRLFRMYLKKAWRKDWKSFNKNIRK